MRRLVDATAWGDPLAREAEDCSELVEVVVVVRGAVAPVQRHARSRTPSKGKRQSKTAKVTFKK